MAHHAKNLPHFRHPATPKGENPQPPLLSRRQRITWETPANVGTVREIKNHEYRVGLTPESVRETAHGRGRSRPGTSRHRRQRRGLRRRRRRDPARRRHHLRRRLRDGREVKGAPARRTRHAAPRSGCSAPTSTSPPTPSRPPTSLKSSASPPSLYETVTGAATTPSRSSPMMARSPAACRFRPAPAARKGPRRPWQCCAAYIRWRRAGQGGGDRRRRRRLQRRADGCRLGATQPSPTAT